MHIDDFDYNYPDELVAQQPLAERSASRLLVLDRANNTTTHSHMRELPNFLRAGDCLVVNTSKVLPMRLQGQRSSGGRVELLLLKRTGQSPRHWEALAYPLKKLTPGAALSFEHNVSAEVIARDDGRVTVEFNHDTLEELLPKIGLPPLPPYIQREARDAYANDYDRYQCVYANTPGSAAAPTAGLHFSDALLAKCKARDVHVEELQLHVGIDTFQPVRVDTIEKHHMHGEQFHIAEDTLARLRTAKQEGRRIIAVGTTSARALESSMHQDFADGNTQLFIYPGYQFRMIDALVTNFHQPKSTLLMMVSALAGRERILAVYQEAIHKQYRLFSYGDAMLIC